jgi:phage shock protein PspC (stress-responsive transcriptional regulator)
MSAENVINEIRDSLNGRPGQPIVLGVCKTLAARFDIEPWLVRAAAIVCGLFFTFITVGVYIVLGFTLKETEPRTRQFFSGLAVLIREWTEKLFGSVRECCGNPKRAGYNDY